MKRTITLILTVILAVSMLAGCSDQPSGLLGTWKTEVNLSEGIRQLLLDELGDSAEYFAIESFTVCLTMTFNADGTYSMTLEEDSVQTAFDALLEDLEAGVVKLLEDQIAQLGLETSVDTILEGVGMTMDSMMDTLTQRLEDKDIVREIIQEFSSEGNFKDKDSKLYLSAGTAFGVDENVYDTYTLDGDTLTLVTHVGGDADEQDLTRYVYPLVFTKAG